ncbi:MAG: hypothetical protein WDZ35_11915 [Crocinitomicaceae bacterium]
MMIDCEKAAKIIDQKDAAEKVGWWSRRKLRFHLVLCKMCKNYKKDSAVLSKIIRMMGKHSNHCLTEQEKAEMKNNLLQK